MRLNDLDIREPIAAAIDGRGLPLFDRCVIFRTKDIFHTGRAEISDDSLPFTKQIPPHSLNARESVHFELDTSIHWLQNLKSTG